MTGPPFYIQFNLGFPKARAEFKVDKVVLRCLVRTFARNQNHTKAIVADIFRPFPKKVGIFSSYK